jgi:hypothetical protein
VKHEENRERRQDQTMAKAHLGWTDPCLSLAGSAKIYLERGPDIKMERYAKLRRSL